MENLKKLTCPQLRAICRQCGMPTYQRKGHKLLKADLVKQVQAAMAGGYAVAPATELVEVHNGARGVARIVYSVLKIIDDVVSYADPATPGRRYETRHQAMVAVQQRLVREANARGPAKPKVQRRPRRRVWSQSQIDKHLAGGQHGWVGSVGV